MTNSKVNASRKQILGALTGIGIASVGGRIIFAAISEPELTRAGPLFTVGTILALAGTLGTFAFLGVKFSVSAKLGEGYSFEIKPE